MSLSGNCHPLKLWEQLLSICSDKTGTLTRNEMMVRAVYANGQLFTISGNGYEPEGDFSLEQDKVNPADYPELIKTLTCGLLCNAASLVEENGRYKIAGDRRKVPCCQPG